MDWQNSLYYLIPTLLIVIFVLPIFVEARVSFNPLYNRGVVALFIFKKKVIYYFVRVKDGGLELSNEKETKLQKLEFSSPKFAVMKKFTEQMKDKIRLKKCYVFYNIGTGDAFSSALVCGLFNQILMQIFLFLKSHKPTASLCVYDTVSYNKTCCELALTVQISVSLFEVAYSYLYSVIITNRRKIHN